MRKAFKLLEITFAAVALVGLVMRISLLKGGDFLLVLSLGLLSVLYFAGGYFQGSPNLKSADGPATEGAAVKIWGGILFSTGIVGVAGTLLFWQGFGLHLLIGLFGSLALLLGLFLTARKSNGPVASAVFNRGAIIALLCAAVWLVPKATLFGLFHRDDPQLVEKWNGVQQHPKDPVYQADFDAYRRQKYSSSK
ncbi:hypothetical protein [Hymenobacter persicinus]|uniref:Uncharacterized protein n=1 Tax=Hymenobacter persicinus TaxID=2025506 RepID=A0A4Q5LB31_9BACT|nr:hypothetical protein [Hymenobacter persicinus]RYU78176.1 hypothetical protein EWM57_15160 [Hymenobacter persicinus]